MALALVLQTKLPPGRRPKEGQNLKPRMNEGKKNQFVSYMNVDFLFGESVCFVNFYPECFRRGKEAKKGPKKVRKEARIVTKEG